MNKFNFNDRGWVQPNVLDAVNKFTASVEQSIRTPSRAYTRTDNGMKAMTSTMSYCVDLFGSIGAMRGKNILPTFQAAFQENPDVALRIAQWSRDVRGGSGERKLFRDILKRLEETNPELLVESKLLDNVPEIGRFDDLLIFDTVAVKARAYSIIAAALNAGNGLCAKWMPRKGPIAADLRKAFGLSPKSYRKMLVSLTNVVETQMCDKTWNEINFSHVPSVAMSRYMTAFHRNAGESFEAYKAALKRNDGTAKVNASAVYPYDVTKLLGGAQDISGGYYRYGNSFKAENLTVAEAMWEALPDYMNGVNVLAVCDNSGSMQSQVPGSETTMLDVAASLTMYTASKSKGAFKDLSVSFSENAQFCIHKGNLMDRLKAVCSMKWGNTNFESVFNLVLGHAIKNRVPAGDMPKMLLVFSDMQFDSTRYNETAMQLIRRKYEESGYEMPAIVYWNLNDYGNKPVRFHEKGAALVSGFSPSLMKTILAADLDKFSPENIMLKAVMDERYTWL